MVQRKPQRPYNTSHSPASSAKAFSAKAMAASARSIAARQFPKCAKHALKHCEAALALQKCGPVLAARRGRLQQRLCGFDADATPPECRSGVGHLRSLEEGQSGAADALVDVAMTAVVTSHKI